MSPRAPLPPDDELFRIAPAVFTGARNRLAAEMRRGGHSDAARAVARRRKPTVALWAANQAARADVRAIDRFVDSVDRLRAAQTARPEDLRAALAHQRETLAVLLTRARTALGSIGANVTPELVARVSGTLLGAAVDPRARGELRAGRLMAERSAPGFEAFEAGGGPAPALASRRPAKRPAADPGRPAREEARRARDNERKVIMLDTARREREARAARLEAADALAAQAQQRRADAEAARREAETLRRQLRVLEQRQAEARRVAKAADRDARRAIAHARAEQRTSGRRRKPPVS